jgi:hypothetical protein
LFGFTEILRVLVAEKVDVDRIGGRWDHAIRAAILNRHYEALKLLLEAGASIEVGGYDECYEFDFYEIFNFSANLLCVRDTTLINIGMLLLDVQAPVDDVLEECVVAISRWLPALEIARSGSPLGEETPRRDADVGDTFWWHLRRNIDVRNTRGRTALHVATLLQRDDFQAEAVVEFLIRGNANVHATDIDGFMPLHYAVERKQNAIVSLLLKANVDINVAGVYGFTALHRAVQSCIFEFEGTAFYIPGAELQNQGMGTPLGNLKY